MTKVTTLNDVMTEAELRLAVVTAASLFGWMWSYNPDSRRVQGDPGLPDLILARGGQLIAVELKTAAGRMSAGQRAWIAACDVYVIRPDALDDFIEGVLR